MFFVFGFHHGLFVFLQGAFRDERDQYMCMLASVIEYSQKEPFAAFRLVGEDTWT